MVNSNKDLTVSLFSRALLISVLPEVGDTLIRVARDIDRKIEQLVKLADEIREDEHNLMREISENWTHEEINEFLVKKLAEITSYKVG